MTAFAEGNTRVDLGFRADASILADRDREKLLDFGLIRKLCPPFRTTSERGPVFRAFSLYAPQKG
jgi:hypothetical protein